MGMFDRIWFKCPKCAEVIEAQSKAGLCTLRDLQQEEVPTVIANDIVGEQVWCGHCDKSYTIAVTPAPPLTVRLGLV